MSDSTYTAFRLGPQQVQSTFEACTGEGIEVDAIVGVVSFDPAAVAAHGELIAAMLLELPTQFRSDVGGGWSFLQACDDRHGNQWTGEHRVMAMLFALGQAAGLVTCQLPREVWSALPGGMPYYVVTVGVRG